jgi:putative ABC transport system permease protein
MRLSKIFKLSLNMLLHSKLRSWLTIIGIFIGVAAVVTIISLGQGLQQSVNSQISGLGQDIITISSGSSRAFGPGEGERTTNVKPLSDKDIQTLKLVPGIKFINGIISGRATVAYQTQNTTLSIEGQDPLVSKEFLTTSLSSGRYLSAGDTRAIVIGDRLANSVFINKISVGYILSINGKPFRVVGILKSSSGLGGGDNSVIMPIKDAREALGSTITLNSNEYSSIQIKVSDVNYINETSNAIEEALINSHHVTKNKEDFSLTSAQALQERFSTVMSGVTLFLGVIAAISLLVGGIGVANTMFTSVLEKTRDIGIMKAIGAKNSDILLIFLFNSGMLGLIGGTLGILFAEGVALIVPYLGLSLGNNASISILISLSLIVESILFSMTIGMLFGAIPAYNASKLKPVEALRYE